MTNTKVSPVEQIISKIQPRHVAALKLLYCEPHRAFSGANWERDLEEEMLQLGIYRIPQQAGWHPLTMLGREVIRELIKRGQWSIKALGNGS